MPFKPLSKLLLPSKKQINRLKWNVFKLNKNKLELKMKERERCKRQPKEQSEKKNKDSFN